MAFHFMTGGGAPSLPSFGWSVVFSPAAGACGLPNPALAFSALLLWISQPSNSLTWVQPDCSSCLRYLSLMAWAGDWAMSKMANAGRMILYMRSSLPLKNADTWRGRLTLACPVATCAIIARLDAPGALNPDVRNTAT